jgi:hypothetical protein
VTISEGAREAVSELLAIVSERVDAEKTPKEVPGSEQPV